MRERIRGEMTHLEETKKKILILDDEATLVRSLKNYLSLYGYEVHTATNGIDGIAAFKQEKFDCVVSDLAMPKQDGSETINQMREYSDNVRIIAITGALIGQGHAEIIKLLGADYYLEKPFSLEKLVTLIEEETSNVA